MHIIDVAKALGVSVATVSRALNSDTAHMVAEKTRRKIERFAREAGYVPNRAAASLSTGRSRTIGLVLPNALESTFFNDYLVKVMAGVYRVLDELGRYNCKIIILPRNKVVRDLDQHVLKSDLDGLLLSPYCDPTFYSTGFPREILEKWGSPVMLLNMNPERIKRFNGVYFDHFDSARKAVTYLIQKGHQRIAMILGDHAFPEAEERFEGYKAAIAAHGLPFRKELVVPGNFLVEGGYDAALTLFRGRVKNPTASAVFCANDETAMGALRALRTLGIACPGDVAVMGFDGLEFGEFFSPRLTSMAQPTRDIAETATRLLIDLIEGRLLAPVSRVLPAQIIVRESA